MNWEDRKKHAAANRRYYRRNTETMRAKARRYDQAHPEAKDARNKQFEERNPTYWRDYQRKRRVRLAWMKFAETCAASRRRLEAMS
jgi:hypothetical protein